MDTGQRSSFPYLLYDYTNCPKLWFGTRKCWGQTPSHLSPVFGGLPNLQQLDPSDSVTVGINEGGVG